MAGSNFLRWFWIVLLFTCAIAVFWPTLWQMESIWRHSETYMHGYFIVPMSLYMIWTRRESLHGLVMQPAVLPALLLIPVCLLWLAAYAIDVGFVTHISQVVAFQLILWHVLGNDIARKIRFPLLFLIFAAPFGESLTPILQDLTADMSVALLRLVDIPVYRQGLYIHTPVSVFEVAVACSGLNFLISSTVISLLFASMYFSKFYKQIIFVLFVPMLAILANGLRAFLLIFIGETTNMAWGFGDDHYYYGWAVFAITILISFRIGEWFSDPPEQSSTAAVQQTSSNNSKMKTRFASTAIAIVILASFYPLRSFLPETIKPATPEAVFEMVGFTALDVNSLGTSFNDGMKRSSLQNSTGVEFFAADYAVRQNEGDLITWHNWLFDQKHWSVTDRETVGSQTSSRQFLQLTSVQGRQYTLLFWYQIGDVHSTNKILIKLLQLKAILLHEPVALGVRMMAVPNQDFTSGKQLLQTIASDTQIFAESSKPLSE